MSTRTLIVVSLVVLALGLGLGLVPGSAAGAAGPFSCGSPWNRDDDAISRQNRIDGLADALGGDSGSVESSKYAERCDDKLNTRGILGGVLAGLAALALVGAAVVRRPNIERQV